MATQGSKETYVQEIGGSDVFVSPSASQEQGNFDSTLQRYADTATELDNNTSSVVGLPNIMGGANVDVLYPDEWEGAEGIYNLDVIESLTIKPKIGSGDITVRGGAAIDDLQSVDVFQDDPYAYAATNSYNYMFNKGNVGSGVASIPTVGNSLDISTVGMDAICDSVVSTVAIDQDWERSIRFVPDTITPASEVFILSKGFSSTDNCQYAISYDSTSIYRTIGGSKVVVGATATYLSLTEETKFTLINQGGQLTPSDTFAINDEIVRDSLTTSRGSVVSARKEMIGGIFPTDADSGTSTLNALGHYRQFCKYMADRHLAYLDIPYRVTSSYVNYTTSIKIGGSGDSIMNGSGEASDNRSDSFFFKIESWAKSLGFDVLFYNQGVGGTTYQSHVPSSLPSPASINTTPNYNSNYANVTRMLKNFRVDILIGNSGVNEYANTTTPVIPYDWYAQLVSMAMISSECARYGKKYIHNTTGGRTNDYEDDYRRDVCINVNSQILQRSQNVINWRDSITDPSTGLANTTMIYDAVHLHIVGWQIK